MRKQLSQKILAPAGRNLSFLLRLGTDHNGEGTRSRHSGRAGGLCYGGVDDNEGVNQYR